MSDHRHRPSPHPEDRPQQQDQRVWGQSETGPYAYGPADQAVYGTHSDPVTYGHGSRRRRDPEPQEPEYPQQPPGGYQYQDQYQGQYQQPPQFPQDAYQEYRQDAYQEPEPSHGRRRAEPDPDFDEHRWGVGDRFDDDDEEPRRMRWGRRKKDQPEEEPEPAPFHAGSPPPPPPPPAAKKKSGGGGGGGEKGLGVLGWTSVVLTSVLVLGTLTAYTLYRQTLGNIKTGASTDDLDKTRPENQTGAINVLLVGSDTRQGEGNARYGQKAAREDFTERTDTIMLLHVSPNRDQARLISFPRDSMVTIPECRDLKTKQIVPAHLGQINAAFTLGGMICTRRTIEALTDIHIDHYIKVDFNGFKNIVNALGGIEICVPRPVTDRQAKLELPAGTQVVRGETALAYVRSRHGFGDGSDIGRIKRQQVFISQIVKKATSSAMLTDIGKLTSFVSAATKSVEMDDQLNTEALLDVAASARKLTAKGFKATTVPWEPYTADKNRVQFKQPAAKNLFDAIKYDTEVRAEPSAPAASASASAPADNTPKPTEAAQVRVQVINGTNTNGRGKEVADALAAQGFKVVEVGNALQADGKDRPTTTVSYKGAGWEGSKLLTAVLRPQVKADTNMIKPSGVAPYTPATPPPGQEKKAVGPVIQLVIGADWDGVKIPLEATDGATTVDSETDICTV
ncbi:LCP family protein [Acrocarpospora catenulata]|uniref:LCP family protein n=1 Tax=Acrocarpospora catenulata TaxID=2836182 RepID=UPI001BD9A504|nr:LCP family protein [Acrocarpospora catenulata]